MPKQPPDLMPKQITAPADKDLMPKPRKYTKRNLRPADRLNSLRQAESALGIPFAHLKIIKQLFPEGFTANGNVIREEVSKYYNEHKAEIIAAVNDTLDELKAKKLKNDILLQELEIDEARKLVVPIVEVEEFLSNFGVMLGGVLKSKIVKELPPHVTGLREEDVTHYCKEFYNELVTLLQSNLDTWNATRNKE